MFTFDMPSFKKGEKVVKVLDVMGLRSVSMHWVVDSVEKSKESGLIVAKIRGGDGCLSVAEYNPQTGLEICPPIPGSTSEIIRFDDGEHACTGRCCA